MIIEILLAALVFSACIEIARRAAYAAGLVSLPNPIVSSHKVPVAYLGGTALLVSYFAMVQVDWLFTHAVPGRTEIARMLSGVCFVILGTWDDLYPLRVPAKFTLQVAICATFLLVANNSTFPEFVVKLLFLTTLVNAYNFVDVMDGLTTLLSGIAIAGLLISQPPAMHTSFALWSLGVGLFCLFLFNMPPAVIYQGDAGSLTLGFLIGTWILNAFETKPLFTAAPWLGLCAIPLLEFAFLLAARAHAGRSIFAGSPDHFSLRLQDQLGWSKWLILGVAAIVGCYFALAPFLSTYLSRNFFVAYLFTSCALATTLWHECWSIPPLEHVTERAVIPS